MTATTLANTSAFTPRRIGHVNLYVSDWLNSLRFYSTVVGLEEVFREPPIKAGFLSSGNTHHDIGFLEARAGARIGRGGFVQTKEGIGAKRELNHFGIEMENEKELVDSYWRLKELDVKIEKTTDSNGLSKSIYVRDPDGTLLQFYADLTGDWRSFWNANSEQLITGGWDPTKDTAPRTTPFYHVNPPQYRSPTACFQPLRVTGATMVVRDLAQSERFYATIGGFRPVARSADGRVILLSARNINRDLTLVAAEPNEAPGLRHFSFKMANLGDLLAGIARLPKFGIAAEACLDHGFCRSVYIRDPDNFLIEFYADRVDDWASWFAQGRPWSYPQGKAWSGTAAEN